MTRILAFTDPHGEASALNAILDVARRERPAIVVCSGDLTYFGKRYEDFLAGLTELGQTVHFVTGNHETDQVAADITAIYPHMKNVGDRWVEASGVQIMGIPGTDKYWPGARVDQGTLERVAGFASNIDRKKPLVLLGHYPPWKSAISGMSEMTPDSGGSKLAREIVKELKPTLMVTGHYHQDFGREDRLGPTRLVNPGPNGRILEV